MDYRQKLSDLGIDMHKIRGNSGKVKCPKCSDGRKKKSDPCLSVNVNEGWYKCHNVGCDFTGNVKFEGGKPKEYKRPQFKNATNCSDEILQWFQTRGISSMTINNAGIQSGFTWFPQLNAEAYCIQFPYFKHGVLANIKHRDGLKNFRLEKDAELVFFGLESLKSSDEYILITEGEIDALSFNEAGVTYAISVPNGASLSSNNALEYLDNCWSYFDNDKKVILALDNDNPGLLLREELSRRIGKERCFKVNFGKHKDANEYFLAEGAQALREVVNPENLIEYPLQGVLTVNDIWDEVEFIMENGLPRGKTTGVFYQFDEYFSFEGSKLCVVTGPPNAGKSPFVDCNALIMSIRHGWKWGVCSMESKPLKIYIVKLMEKILGKFIRPGVVITAEQKERLRNFLQEHFFFIEANYDNNESDTLDFILSASSDLVRKFGIKGLIIDPWNKIEHQIKNGETETNYVSRALDQIIRHEQKHDLFVFLVAHPSKPKSAMKKGETWVPSLYDVSGSNNFYNKPDWGITVARNFATECTEVHITKCKWEHLGKLGAVAMKYNGANGRLYTQGDKPDFSNWLDTLPGKQFYKKPEEDFTEDFVEEEIYENNEAPF